MKIPQKIYEEKSHFVMRLGLLLSVDPRSGVEKIRYKIEGNEEYAEVTFNGGNAVDVRITTDSLGAIYKDVGRHVYGF